MRDNERFKLVKDLLGAEQASKALMDELEPYLDEFLENPNDVKIRNRYYYNRARKMNIADYLGVTDLLKAEIDIYSEAYKNDEVE